MVSHNFFKSCVKISRIWNTLDIKSKKSTYYCLLHPYITYCINIWSVRPLFATPQQPHSRDIFINQKISPLDKLINQQVCILAYKVINGTYMLNDFLNQGDVRHQIQLRNTGDLRIPLYATAHSQLFVRYRAINTWNSLSGDLGSSSSLCTFKNKLRQLYLSLTMFSNIHSMII